MQVKSFYKNQIELEDIKEDLSKYIPNIVDFVEQYVSKSRNVGVKTKSNKNNVRRFSYYQQNMFFHTYLELQSMT